MFFKKILKVLKCFRWPTLFALLLYVVFIAVLLSYNARASNANGRPHRSAVDSSFDANNSENLKISSPDYHNEMRDGRNNADSVGDGRSGLGSFVGATGIATPGEKKILQAAFESANLNHDAFLTIPELGRYINKQIRDHTDKAIKMNPLEFSKVDQSPRDGLVTWEEYHAFVLRKHGLNEAYIKDHKETKHAQLTRRAREDMMRDKARWSEAARSDPFSLTLDEFLAFQHPESSTSNLLALVDDLLRLFDVDGDDRLTIDEFSDVTVDEDDEKYRKSIISKTVVERREEFKRLIDTNKDNKADRAELVAYVDPRHPRYALQEAVTLINITDTNKDGQLSLSEMWTNSKIFMTSKMIDTAKSFHEEF